MGERGLDSDEALQHDQAVDATSAAPVNRQTAQAAADTAIAREHGVGVAAGQTVKAGQSASGWFGTGGMLGGLVGGQNLRDVYSFTAPRSGAFFAQFNGDYAHDFGAQVVVRDAATHKAVASAAEYARNFDVKFSAVEGATYEIVVTPLKTSAYLRNPDSRKASDSYKWLYLGDRAAGGGRYTLGISP